MSGGYEVTARVSTEASPAVLVVELDRGVCAAHAHQIVLEILRSRGVRRVQITGRDVDPGATLAYPLEPHL